jgi:hypothetical protein
VIRRLRRRAPPTPPAPVAPISLTSGIYGHTHLISAADLDRTNTTNSNTYRTLSGRTVLPGIPRRTPGPRCTACHSPSTEPTTAPRRASTLR